MERGLIGDMYTFAMTTLTSLCAQITAVTDDFDPVPMLPVLSLSNSLSGLVRCAFITITDDLVSEGTENFQVTLTPITTVGNFSFSPTVTEITILDDDIGNFMLRLYNIDVLEIN